MAVSKDDINGLKTKLLDARTALVTMLGESDKTKQTQCRATVKKLTDETLALLPQLIEKAKGTNVEAKLKDMKTAWDIFRDTRDNEVISNYFAGKVAEAKAVGGGIQKERFAKISSMVDEILTMT
ncbi:MAG: MCP four helix bundle domain-containing protein [Planctomycetia bacterium]|nr:MCP four helix bundle domain-containing protein [Planctomycetia bacterium]